MRDRVRTTMAAQRGPPPRDRPTKRRVGGPLRGAPGVGPTAHPNRLDFQSPAPSPINQPTTESWNHCRRAGTCSSGGAGIGNSNAEQQAWVADHYRHSPPPVRSTSGNDERLTIHRTAFRYGPDGRIGRFSVINPFASRTNQRIAERTRPDRTPPASLSRRSSDRPGCCRSGLVLLLVDRRSLPGQGPGRGAVGDRFSAHVRGR